MTDAAFDREFDKLEKEAESRRRMVQRREQRKSTFPEMSVSDLSKVLGITIKHDDVNKVVTFFCYLSAYTEESQFNIIFNAPSASGKSYIALEVASLFPKDDVMIRGYCSAKAFFHDPSAYWEDEDTYTLDLERKIIVFIDQPHPNLLEHMRPLLSHDQKRITMKITDKTERKGLRTKTLVLVGYPSVVFCTAGLKMDEQETTRFLLLSPETTKEKIGEAVVEAVRKGADPDAYFANLNSNPDRHLLMHRIAAIKEEDIRCVKIPDKDLLAERFLSTFKPWKPRHQRDVKRLLSLIQSHALLNLWHRLNTDDPHVIIASKEDIEAAFSIWGQIAVSQELNLPPYVLEIYEEVIEPLYEQAQGGLRRHDVLKAHQEVYGRMLNPQTLGKEILPMLSRACLVYQENDPSDRRNKLIFPSCHREDGHNSSRGEN